MLNFFTLLFKSSNESTAWHYIELIDHALAIPFQSKIFLEREHSPRLPSLTCLARAVEHHMKEMIISDLNITSVQ